MAIKVLVVDDSLVFRETLSKLIDAEVGIEVVGTAIDAFTAKEKIEKLNPDVLILDVEMPRVSGIDFLKELLPKRPIPTVVVTSTAISAFDAISAGAVDFVKKPLVKSRGDIEDFAKLLAQKIKIASIAKVKHFSHPADKPAPAGISKIALGGNFGSNKDLVIALGASTGGTDALLAVVQDLPANTPGIVIVQHMPPVFTKMYAERLDRICKMRCKEAQDGDRVERGKIIVGAGGFHLRLAKDAKGYYVTSKEGEKVSGHCPSVDVLFDSVADTAGRNAVAAILTGMGSDGAKGLKKIRDKGGFTIGQDKDTCVVYGMPMVAYQMGGVCQQAPLTKIPEIILQHCK